MSRDQLTYIHTNDFRISAEKSDSQCCENAVVERQQNLLDGLSLESSGTSETPSEIRHSKASKLPDENCRWVRFPGIEHTPICSSISTIDPMELYSGCMTGTIEAVIQANGPGEVEDPEPLSPQSLNVLGSQNQIHNAHEMVSSTTAEEACLMRHFIDSLSCWVSISFVFLHENMLIIGLPKFDISDKERYFEITVPQRATFCSILKYSILATSAAHLILLSACRGEVGGAQLSGIKLPCLSMDTAFQYYHICVSYIQGLVNRPKKPYNDDIIAAITILRLYEQLGGKCLIQLRIEFLGTKIPPKHPQ